MQQIHFSLTQWDPGLRQYQWGFPPFHLSDLLIVWFLQVWGRKSHWWFQVCTWENPSWYFKATPPTALNSFCSYPLILIYFQLRMNQNSLSSSLIGDLQVKWTWWRRQSITDRATQQHTRLQATMPTRWAQGRVTAKELPQQASWCRGKPSVGLPASGYSYTAGLEWGWV